MPAIAKKLRCHSCEQFFPKLHLTGNLTYPFACAGCLPTLATASKAPHMQRKPRAVQPGGKPPPHPASPVNGTQGNAAEPATGEKLWYVLQCEPGRETRCKKDLTRRVRIESLEHLVGRVYCPTHLKEVSFRKPGPVVAEGVEKEATAARQRGNLEADQRTHQLGADGASAHPGFKVSVWQEEKTGLWHWKVRVAPSGDPETKISKVKKYPGYIICNLVYEPDVENLLKKTRFSWGLLLRPVVTGYRVKVVKSKIYGFVWKVLHPETDEVMEKGHHPNKEACRELGKAAAAKLSEFKPTALSSAEAAEHLIEQKAINQIAKDKEELNRAILNYRVGDTVKVRSGNFKGLEAKVVSIDKKADSANPFVDLETIILGRTATIRLKHKDIES